MCGIISFSCNHKAFYHKYYYEKPKYIHRIKDISLHVLFFPFISFFLQLLVLLYYQILLSYKFVCLYDFLLTLRKFSLFMQLEVEHSISCNQTVFPTSYFPHNYVRLFNSPYNWKILMQVWFKNEFVVKKSIKDI